MGNVPLVRERWNEWCFSPAQQACFYGSLTLEIRLELFVKSADVKHGIS